MNYAIGIFIDTHKLPNILKVKFLYFIQNIIWNFSVFFYLLYLSASVSYTVLLKTVSARFFWRIQFCRLIDFAGFLPLWSVILRRRLWRIAPRRFSCELCRYWWAKLTWCTTAHTLMFSTCKMTGREGASHMGPVEEIMTQEVTSYLGFGLRTSLCKNLKQI